ncbi:MAG: single-stranded-DNA-specific exonuclease RecJ [Candidatus Marinimicrobia bacterium]|nr:single-stranded-DNA-specific exonuclease RecJ [Candidatus Neomarinimicrobiota bacterium]MCF7830147.1 single-stranded-DNA-specific exonuclease RecJ [Candidatus Neomarinimicrobiota bacterium]MCF7882224.1 single-stranded-DNA-specific exonuclease RecJ [Candidatus Neomarinimicrobiota bacterium]
MRKKKLWKYREFGQAKNQETVRSYADNIGVIPPVASILLNRNLDSKEKADTFFNPSFDHLWDPYMLAGMEKAIEKVADVISSGEKLLIFGDYDVDGTSGTALLTWFFRDNLVDVDYYIPDRESEGYGLSKQGIEYARDIGASLIITCDCAINAFEEVDYANELGIPIIITDHHRPPESLPDAAAILNPNRIDCEYPFTGLCGCGVAFKYAQAMCRAFSGGAGPNDGDWSEERLFTHLDLVALATAADMVPVTGENRMLVHAGIQQLPKSNKPGLRALIKVSGLEKKLQEGADLNVGNIVFQIAPRINAVGRLGSATRAVDLLTTENRREAKSLAKILDQENTARREIERSTYDSAIYLVQSKYPKLSSGEVRSLVLWEEDWHQGVIGIVASKLKEKYHLPIVIISLDNGVGKGSARSISGFDLYDAFTECADHFIGYGGHAMAAGLSIETENLEQFEEQFQRIAAREITDDMLVPGLTLETDIRFTDVGSQMMQMLQRLGPYGPKNMRPVFGARNLSVAGLPRIVGENHLKFKVKQGRTMLDAIAFQMGEYYELLIKNEPIDLAFVVEKNRWNGREFIQLNVRDIILSKENEVASPLTD